MLRTLFAALIGSTAVLAAPPAQFPTRPAPDVVWWVMASRVVDGLGDVLEDVHVHVYLAKDTVNPPGGEIWPAKSFKLSDHPIRLDGVVWDPKKSWWDEPQHELLQWAALHTPFTYHMAADGSVDFTSLRGDAREAEIRRINTEVKGHDGKWRPLSDKWGLMTIDEQRALNVKLSGKNKSEPTPDPRSIPLKAGGPVPSVQRPFRPDRPPVEVPRCENCFPRRID